jgi:hypothetical protein
VVKHVKILNAQILTTRLVPKYVEPYKVVNKPYENIYPLLLRTTFVENPTFHVSKLKSFNKDERHEDEKQAYHPIYDFIEHRLDR